MAQDPNDAALITCMEAAREHLIQQLLNDICGSGSGEEAEYAARLNAINQLLAFLKVK